MLPSESRELTLNGYVDPNRCIVTTTTLKINQKIRSGMLEFTATCADKLQQIQIVISES